MVGENWIWAIMIILVLMPVMVLGIPLTIYIKSVLWLRKKEILCCLSGEVLKAYFNTFYPADLNSDPPPDSKALEQKFDQLYSSSFGQTKFVIPTVLLLVTITTIFIFTAQGIKSFLLPFLGSTTTTQPYSSIAIIGFAGFAGGYMWVLLSILKRTQERQLTPFDLYAGCARIILCIPIAFAFVSFFKGILQAQALAGIAFLLGAFPMDSLLTFMRRTATSKLKLEQSFSDQATVLIELQGIERDQAEIFAKEGVSTMLQLAYSDPVDLTIRTGFSFSYTVDCCSQALAWLNFEKDMPKLRRYGLRGAQEICTFVMELTQKTGQSKKIMDEEQLWAEKTMEVLSIELTLDVIALRHMLDQIAYDPYTQFLYDVWQPDWN